MSTYKNWQLGTDFQPYENLLLNYIFAQWSISDPPKGSTMQEYLPTSADSKNVVFYPGFPTAKRRHQITAVRLYTRKIANIATRGHWLFEVGINVHFYCKRLTRPSSEPAPGVPIEIWNMEEEVERIIGEAKINAIPGVMKLDYEENQRVHTTDDNFLKTLWESNTLVKMQLTKMTTSSPI